jgi:agmatinase
VREFGIADTLARIGERVGDARVYVSFDVDFVDPAFAPGIGTPEVGGFTSWEALRFLRGLARLKIVGCDVVEVYPAYDPAQITAFLGAAAAYEMLTLIAIGTKQVGARGR